MELTVKELLDMSASLKKLLNESLPIKTAYKLSRMVKSIDGETKTYNEKKNELVGKYGEKVGRGMQINQEIETPEGNIPNPKFIEFLKDLEEIQSVKIELPDIKVKIDELGDINFPAVDLSNLERFIDEK
jgi:hypothetical protein